MHLIKGWNLLIFIDSKMWNLLTYFSIYMIYPGRWTQNIVNTTVLNKINQEFSLKLSWIYMYVYKFIFIQYYSYIYL